MYWSTSNPTCSKCNTCIALSNVWYQRQWHWKSVEMVFLTALGLGRDWEMEVVHGGTIEHNGPICYLTIIIIIIMTIMTMTQICMNNECEKRWTNKSDHLWMCEWTQIADCGQTTVSECEWGRNLTWAGRLPISPLENPPDHHYGHHLRARARERKIGSQDSWPLALSSQCLTLF